MFNFARCGFTNPRLGKKLHIIVTLIDMREATGVTNEDRDALKHAIEYIKALEAQVSSLQRGNIVSFEEAPPSGKEVIVNVNVSGGPRTAWHGLIPRFIGARP